MISFKNNTGQTLTSKFVFTCNVSSNLEGNFQMGKTITIVLKGGGGEGAQSVYGKNYFYLQED